RGQRPRRVAPDQPGVAERDQRLAVLRLGGEHPVQQIGGGGHVAGGEQLMRPVEVLAGIVEHQPPRPGPQPAPPTPPTAPCSPPTAAPGPATRYDTSGGSALAPGPRDPASSSLAHSPSRSWRSALPAARICSICRAAVDLSSATPPACSRRSAIVRSRISLMPL